MKLIQVEKPLYIFLLIFQISLYHLMAFEEGDLNKQRSGIYDNLIQPRQITTSRNFCCEVEKLEKFRVEFEDMQVVVVI